MPAHLVTRGLSAMLALEHVANVRWPVARTRPYHRAVTLAAIWSAIFTAESAGLALHVLMSMMMLFLCASARPQPQPGAPAFC